MTNKTSDIAHQARQIAFAVSVNEQHRIGNEAADEIERLRSAGDALADGIRRGHWDDVLNKWDELRHG